jgi:hypothetical protein
MSPGTYWIGDPCYLTKTNTLLQKVQTSSNPNYGKDLIRNGEPVLTSDGRKIKDFSFSNDDGIYDVGGKRISYLKTQDGDGVFVDNYGNEYGVDSGCLIGILISDIEETDLIQLNHYGELFNERNSLFSNGRSRSDGHFHLFTSPWSFNNSNGVLCFGDVMIDTNYEDDYDSSVENGTGV